MEPIFPSDKNDTCYMIEKQRYILDNQTTPFYINLGSDYNGIPEVLVLNLIFFACGILCFTFMRRWFWNYGRIALHRIVSRKDLAKDYNVFSHLTTSPPLRGLPMEEEGGEITEEVTLDYYDTGYCGWLPLLFRLKDGDILRKCGPDALQYARFQRMVMLYMFIIMVLCLLIILPINMTDGYITHVTSEFRATTIGNIHPSSRVLWVHILLTISYLFLCYWAIRRFMNPKYTEEGAEAEALAESCTPTIMIRNLPLGVSGRVDLITKYFNEVYPEFTVVSVLFAYDIAQLAEVERKLEVAEMALSKARNSNDDPLIASHRCGMISCCCRNVRATTYYEQEIQRLRNLRSELKMHAEGHPLPFCLVSFASVEQAQRIVSDFARFSCSNMRAGRGFYSSKTSIGRDLRTSRWQVKIAPKATDIKWENLGIKYRLVRWTLLNMFVFILLFFLSTPSMVMSLWFSLGKRLKIPDAEERSPFLAHVMPSVLLLASTTLLPYIIAFGEEWTYHTTKSGKNLALMTKTFVFMLFMVLILPSLGMENGVRVVKSMFNKEYYISHWECIFLQDTVAFFVNFLISTTLIGLALELLRSAHLAYYIYRMCKVASKFELESARLASIFPFPFGLNYAYMLVIFAVAMVYSTVCPLITIFGFLYFVLKYFIDRYNMYFAYDSIDISPKLHRRATDFLLLSCLLAQLVLLAFIVSRSIKADVYPYGQMGFMIAAFVLSFLAYTGHLTVKFFPKWLCDCLAYKQQHINDDRDINQNLEQVATETPEPSGSPEVELSTNHVVVAPANYGAVNSSQRS